MRFSALVGACSLLVLGLFPLPADAGQYIVYLHGRENSGWGAPTANAPGWTNVTLSYDGNARLSDGTVSQRVKETVGRFCSGENVCIAVCNSAGCMRLLKAVDDLTAEGQTLAMLWAEGSASAAGGTKLAELARATYFFRKPIDQDLRRDSARSTWGYIQDAMAGSALYHLAGRYDKCTWYGCGNWVLPAGICDGAVCVDSAGGASRAGSFSNGCTLATEPGLYPGRHWDTEAQPCEGMPRAHGEMDSQGPLAVERFLGTR